MKEEYKALYEKFGLNVVYYRKRKKLTQLQLAELVDIDRSHISAIELGNVGVSFDVIFKLCEVLDTRVEYLVSSDDFFALVHAEDGAKGVASAQQLLDCAGALFAGGDMSEDDKDKVMLALQKIYWKSKEKNKKYSSK